MNIDECFEKRLLRKERPDMRKAGRSMEIALEKLDKAKKAHESGVYEASVILAYNAAFHAARAVLFRDGIVEKSHACVAAYLKERVKELEPSFVSIFDTLRFERHDSMYGLESQVKPGDSEYAIKTAQGFVERISRLIGLKK